MWERVSVGETERESVGETESECGIEESGREGK